jgi:hypothetical protein
MDEVHSSASSLADNSPPLLRLPLELFLHIFSFADRSSLFALHSTSLAFYELATPSLYQIAHFDDLPHPSRPPIASLAKRVLDLALDSVHTLHLTLSKRKLTQRILPLIHLPNLQHLFIHHIETSDLTLLPLTCCADFLSTLNPVSITFCLPSLSRPRYWDVWELDGLSTSSWSAGWSRLEEIIFRGGILYEPTPPNLGRGAACDDVLALAGSFADKQFQIRPPQVTYDVRTVEKKGMAAARFPREMFWYDPDDYPDVLDGLIRTSSEETKAWLGKELEWMDEEYRSRIEIRLEDKAEGETVLSEMAFWRGGGRSEL